MSANTIVGLWFVVNLLALLVAVRRGERRRVPAWVNDDLTRAIAAHVWCATPGLSLREPGDAQYVRAWGEIAEDRFFELMDRWRDEVRRGVALVRWRDGAAA